MRRTRDTGVPDADVALADLEECGGRSVVARAIVQKLAEELLRRVHTTARVEKTARGRSLLAPLEWS